jgi:fucose 4-O-acetylase-like acetyltransferase
MVSLAAQDSLASIPASDARTSAADRDIGIDTMRGFAILMVIGIHSMQQPLNAWETAADAVLRPCVPIFLFVSGYLTALSGKVPLRKRMMTAIIPYVIAFAAAYLYMALHNPAMDHRPTILLARFLLAYVFVYYYVFVYIGCTFALWIVFTMAHSSDISETRLVALLLLAILFGLIVGAYLDPLLSRLGLSESQVEETRMRDIPFWFSFAALGALAGIFRIRPALPRIGGLLLGATLMAYLIYACVRLFQIGDAADYDSLAFFGYAASLCILLMAMDVEWPAIASLGSGSYFIYLWHIFFVMLLRDHTPLHTRAPLTAAAITYLVATAGSIVALIAVRELAPARLHRWLGA